MSTYVFTRFVCKPLLSECLGIFFWYNILTHNSQLFITRVICIKVVIYFFHYFDVLIACNYAYFINVQLSYDVFPRCCKILFLTWINEVIVKDLVCWFLILIFIKKSANNFRRVSFPHVHLSIHLSLNFSHFRSIVEY